MCNIQREGVSVQVGTSWLVRNSFARVYFDCKEGITWHMCSADIDERHSSPSLWYLLWYWCHTVHARLLVWLECSRFPFFHLLENFKKSWESQGHSKLRWNEPSMRKLVYTPRVETSLNIYQTVEPLPREVLQCIKVSCSPAICNLVVLCYICYSSQWEQLLSVPFSFFILLFYIIILV